MLFGRLAPLKSKKLADSDVHDRLLQLGGDLHVVRRLLRPKVCRIDDGRRPIVVLG